MSRTDLQGHVYDTMGMSVSDEWAQILMESMAWLLFNGCRWQAALSVLVSPPLLPRSHLSAPWFGTSFTPCPPYYSSQ